MARAKAASSKDGQAAKQAVGEQRKRVNAAASHMRMIADASRVQILQMLGEGEKHVGAMCEAIGQSQPAVSHHLALLRHSGMVEARREGKQNIYSLTELGESLARLIRAVGAIDSALP